MDEAAAKLNIEASVSTNLPSIRVNFLRCLYQKLLFEGLPVGSSPNAAWHGSASGCAAAPEMYTLPPPYAHKEPALSGHSFFGTCAYNILLFVDFQVTSKPQMIDEVDRRLIQLEMEKLSLRKETRADALKRVEQIDEEMSELQDKQVKHPFLRPVAYHA